MNLRARAVLVALVTLLLAPTCGTETGGSSAPSADIADGGQPGDGTLDQTSPDGAVPDEATPDAGADTTGDDGDGPGDLLTPPDHEQEVDPWCNCQTYEHCDDEGECVDDVCTEGQTTCASTMEQKICNEDGSGFDVAPCPGGEICYLGVCQTPVCDPEAAPVCEDGQKKACNSIGTEWIFMPCPGGTVCKDGGCEAVEPNVILLMDTSGSMNWVNTLAETLADCEGADCAPWAWPQCDDPEDPQTRFGKAKKALQSVLMSEAAGAVRMALQRFPQKFDLFKLLGKSEPTCEGVPMWGFDLASTDNTQVHLTHVMQDLTQVNSLAGEVFPVPFGPGDEDTVAAVAKWVDFEHTYSDTGETCTNLSKCSNPIANKACIDGKCMESEDPELRAMGNTPIGRALFYGGEVYRQLVVVEGRSCAADAECGSPHYTCVDGACHDPFRTCRPNLIVLFSDGGETIDTWPDKFFHPRVQAKRLHYGLGCATDDDCLSGATCQAGVCDVADTELPDGVCHLTDVPCVNNDPCFEDYKYKCGPAQTCSGTCEDTGVAYVDEVGANVLRDPAGVPFSVTIHVVDASQQTNGNQLVAALGGGEHVPVDLDDLSGLIEAFLPLLDIKLAPGTCP